MSNTICYFDINIANQPAGRITFELYDELLPKVRSLPPVARRAVQADVGRLRPTSSSYVSVTRPMRRVSSWPMPVVASTAVSRGELPRLYSKRDSR